MLQASLAGSREAPMEILAVGEGILADGELYHERLTCTIWFRARSR